MTQPLTLAGIRPYTGKTETVDALYLAGLRLDAAAAEFQRICSTPGDPDEITFGRAEAAVETARDEYRRLLAERAGQDADEIERRLAA